LPDYVCQLLLLKKDFRFIGDAEDQNSFDESRIRSIMESCGAYVAILPHRGEGRTSKYIIKEIILAKKIGLPSLIVADNNVQLSKLDLFDDIKESIIQMEERNSEDMKRKMPNGFINDFVEEYRDPIRPHHLFFATDFKNSQRNEIIREHIQRITAIPCITGDKLTGQQVSNDITKTISGALAMIADISGDNLNTLIEVGIALGAGITTFLVALGPSHTPTPFMLRDKQILWYKDDVELLGYTHRIAYKHRRRIFEFHV
jgi:hypothetical protein